MINISDTVSFTPAEIVISCLGLHCQMIMYAIEHTNERAIEHAQKEACLTHVRALHDLYDTYDKE